MDESDHGAGTAILMTVFLSIALLIGLLAVTADGWTGSTTNPVVKPTPITPCQALNASYQSMLNTVQAYQFDQATQAEVQTSLLTFQRVITAELSALAPSVRQALGPVHDEIVTTVQLAQSPDVTNREFADQTQKVANAASFIPRICPAPDEG